MDAESDVLRTLQNYYDTFNTFDVSAMLQFFHEPCLAMSPSPQGVIVAPTHDRLASVITTVIDWPRSRGFSHSALSVGRVDVLSATSCMVRGVAIRYAVTGGELERVGVTYVLHNAGNGWKIAVLITHDP
jgi:ketosteroid isomerase-like protein